MRYGSRDLNLEAFLGSRGSTASGLAPTDSCLGSSPRICLRSIPTHLHRIPKTGLSTILRPFFAQSHKYRIINPFPISYAFQPGLRVRLTLGRLPLPRKPWIYGEYVFTYFIVTHVSIITSLQSSMPSDTPSARSERSPTQSPKEIAKASVPCLAPLHFRRSAIEPVSYYAFFKRWLLLSQRPGCLHNATTLTTEHAFGGLSCRSGLLPF